MQKVKRKKTGGISFITAMLFICLVVVGILCYTRFQSIIQQRARLQAENSSLKAQSTALSEQLRQIRAQEEFGKDSHYIESVARAQLDMVYPGEVIFRVTTDKNK
ncbi:MAG: septum formation initiator family protein [Clostridiales bacterium]|nr:septum formation initiator family protein [Clostridiales bacterium]